MPKTALMIHGSSLRTKIHEPGYIVPHRRHWHGWLEDRLKEYGFRVFNPDMPNDWKPKYKEWKTLIDNYPINKKTIIAATSAGAPFTFKYLEEGKLKAKKIIINAPSYYLSDDEIIRFGEFVKFDINKSKNLADEFTIFISNDEKRRVKSAKLYQKILDAKLINLPNRGHFCFNDNPEKNDKFPELLEEILNTK